MYDKSITELTDKMTRASIDMLQKIRHKPVSQRGRDFLKRLLGRGRASDRDMLFWPAGFLLLGLVESGDPEAKAAAARYFEHWVGRKEPVRYADDALAGYAALRLYEETEDAAARETAEAVSRFLCDAPRDAAGSIIYHPSPANRCIYADGTGMTALFLAAYGQHDGRTPGRELLAGADQPVGDTGRSVSAFAKLQLDNYRKYGMDDRTGLPYHGYLLKEAPDGDLTSEKKGLIGWGRAVGFLLMGEAGICAAGVEDDRKRLLSAVSEDLRPDGLFPWQLTNPEGHVDTSASAMIGWALSRMETEPGSSREGSETASSVKEMIRQLTGGLSKHVTPEGLLTDSLAECVDFAQHPQRYGTYPWGQGAALAFLSRAL